MFKVNSGLIIKMLALLCIIAYGLFAFLVLAGGDPKARAELGMVSGLLL